MIRWYSVVGAEDGTVRRAEYSEIGCMAEQPAGAAPAKAFVNKLLCE